MRDRPRRLLPPVCFVLALALILVFDRFVPGPRWTPAWVRPVGGVVIGLGVVLFVATVAAFHRTGTPLRPFKGPGVLMTGGTFRISRNPIYLGMTLLLIGACFLSGSLVPIVVPFVFAAFIQIRFIEAEEEFLTEHFGDAYRAYRSRVRRWL